MIPMNCSPGYITPRVDYTALRQHWMYLEQELRLKASYGPCEVWQVQGEGDQIGSLAELGWRRSCTPSSVAWCVRETSTHQGRLHHDDR